MTTRVTRPAPVEDGIVRRLDPDRPPILGDALELARLRLAAPERLPEEPVRVAVAFGLGHEHRMTPPHDLGPRVAHEIEEIGIGDLDDAVRGKFDPCARSIECDHERTKIGIEKRHVAFPRSGFDPVAFNCRVILKIQSKQDVRDIRRVVVYSG